MSAIPLSRDGSPVIVVAANVGEYVEHVTMYGLGDPALRTGIYPVYTADDAYTLSMGLPSTTPWCVTSDRVSVGARKFMETIFGPPKLISKALNVQNNEYAMDPRVLARAGA